MIELLGIMSCAYLIGSVPVGFLVARWQGVRDIRDYGSGNIGATNVARVLGIKYFFLVLLLDFAKAYVALWALQMFGFDQLTQICVSLALLVGNAYPVFLDFRGGKGIATSVGIMLALNPWLLCYALLCWVAVLIWTRTAGKASVATLMAAPIMSAYLLYDSIVMVSCVSVLSLWGLFRHRTNITMYYTALRQ